MDEPTAALGVQETARVEELITRLRGEGHAIILISHNFDQVLQLSDAVWVMRAGNCVAGRRTADTDGDEIVALITGARPGDYTGEHQGATHDPDRRGAQPDWSPRAGVGRRHRPASVESAVAQTVSAGFDLLEFSLHDSVSLDRAKTRELLAANGIQSRALGGWRATPTSRVTIRPSSSVAPRCWRSRSRSPLASGRRS